MSIPTDDTNTGPSDDAAVEALMASLAPKGGAPAADDGNEDDPDDDDGDEPGLPLDDGNEDDTEDDAGDEGDEGDEEDSEGDEEGEGDEPLASQVPEVTDETTVKVVVNGEEQEFTVGSLKRLAGQEAALTQKSQEADTVGQRAAATLQGAIEAVLEDLSAYGEIDWVLEGSRMDPEEFAWHREQHNKLQGRYQKLIENAQTLESTVKARQEAQMKRDAVECVRVLSDPEQGIPGWNDALYSDILSYAVGAGLPESDVATIVNPQVLKIINKARLHDEGQKAAAEKVNLTPRRVRKGGGAEPIPEASAKAQKRLEDKVRSGRGSDDDAIALLTGRWGVKRK